MRETGRGWTECIPVAVVIGIHNDDRLLVPHFDDESPGLFLLVGRQAQIGRGFGSHWTVDVEPGVQHTHFNESIEPCFGQQVHVRLTEAGADPCDNPSIKAVLQPLHGAAVDLLFAAPLIADNFVSLNTDQRSDVAQLMYAAGDFRCNKVSVRKDLKIAVRMFSQDVEQLRMHERLATDDAEERIAHLA